MPIPAAPDPSLLPFPCDDDEEVTALEEYVRLFFSDDEEEDLGGISVEERGRIVGVGLVLGRLDS